MGKTKQTRIAVSRSEIKPARSSFGASGPALVTTAVAVSALPPSGCSFSAVRPSASPAAVQQVDDCQCAMQESDPDLILQDKRPRLLAHSLVRFRERCCCVFSPLSARHEQQESTPRQLRYLHMASHYPGQDESTQAKGSKGMQEPPASSPESVTFAPFSPLAFFLGAMPPAVRSRPSKDPLSFPRHLGP